MLTKKLTYIRQDYDKPILGKVNYSITIDSFYRLGTDVSCYFKYDDSEWVKDNELKHIKNIPPNGTVGIMYLVRTENYQPSFNEKIDAEKVKNNFSINVHCK